MSDPLLNHPANKAMKRRPEQPDAPENAIAPRLFIDAIYFEPNTDNPNTGIWTVRRWTIIARSVLRSETTEICTSLEEARRWIPKGRVCRQRVTEDEPTLVEVWL